MRGASGDTHTSVSPRKLARVRGALRLQLLSCAQGRQDRCERCLCFVHMPCCSQGIKSRHMP